MVKPYVTDEVANAREELEGRALKPPSVFNEAMIDIETMSLHPHNALILSIGMIEFDPAPISGVLIGSRSLIVLDITEQLLIGRHVDPKTQAWWAAQPQAASDHWTKATEHWSAAGAISAVRTFCFGKQRVWANGTQFDLSNLVGLKDQLVDSIGDLWHYRAPRDMRTFCEQTTATRLEPDDPNCRVAHHPVSDCEVQAGHVWAHYQG